jgi:hypothetical protein
MAETMVDDSTNNSGIELDLEAQMSNGASPEQYITDADGNRTAVLVPIDVYERLLDAYEEIADLAAIQAYETTQANGTDDELISIDQAIAEYEAHYPGGSR